MLSALDVLLRSSVDTAQLFNVRASMLWRVEVLLADLKLAQGRSSEHDLAKQRQTLLAQSLSFSLIQHGSTIREYSLCFAELVEIKEQLEELKRKVAKLVSQQLELKGRMEAS